MFHQPGRKQPDEGSFIRRVALKEPEEWQPVAWKPVLSDWKSELTDQVHLVFGAENFANALDEHKDSSFVVHATTVDEFEHCGTW